MIHIQRDVISGQSRGCWLCIQIRYIRFLFTRFWKRDSSKQAIHLYIFAPKHDPEKGYSCTKVGIRW